MKPISKELWEQIRPHVISASMGFFSTYGADCEYRGETHEVLIPTLGVLGAVGFYGEQLCGNLAISAPMNLVQRTFPLQTQQLDDWLDWMGEVANQLLGRLKNQLIPYGVVLESGLPITASGVDLVTHLSGGDITHALQFAYAGERIYLQIDGKSTPGLVLRASPSLSKAPVVEGEMLLF